MTQTESQIREMLDAARDASVSGEFSPEFDIAMTNAIRKVDPRKIIEELFSESTVALESITSFIDFRRSQIVGEAWNHLSINRLVQVVDALAVGIYQNRGISHTHAQPTFISPHLRNIPIHAN